MESKNTDTSNAVTFDNDAELQTENINQQSKMARASFRMPKTTKETLSIESFPSEMQGMLSEAFDKDGDGVIDGQELAEAANLYIQTKSTNGLLRKGICFTAALSFAFVAGIAGLTDASKDTRVEGRALMTKQEEPVSVSNNELKLVLKGSNQNISRRLGTRRGKSDERLKEDITFIGKSPSGIPTYTFKYRQGMDTIDDGMDTMGTYFGVMAQDLLEIAPEAVIEHPLDGYYRVDYSKIDVDFIKLM